MERQKHGFNFEQRMIEEYNIKKESNYTAEWDGYLNSKPVSIKLEKMNSDIELGDIFRQSHHNEDFIMIVGFWEGTKENVKEVHYLDIKGKEWKSLFPDNFEDEYRALLDNITNNKEDDEKWREAIKIKRQEWKRNTLNLIRPRFKRDHKKQKRIQCAINNKDFYSYFVSNYEK